MLEISWQDAVLMAGNIVFFVALLPSITGIDKPSRWTSLMNAVTLSIFTYTYYTLSLPYAALGMAPTAIAWWVLFFQKWHG